MVRRSGVGVGSGVDRSQAARGDALGHAQVEVGRPRRRSPRRAPARRPPTSRARRSALPKNSSGPVRRSSDSPSSLQISRSARARSAAGAAAATLSGGERLAVLHAPVVRPAPCCRRRQVASALDPAHQARRRPTGTRLPPRLHRGDRLALGDLDAQVVREVGLDAQAGDRRRTARPPRRARRVDVQRAHAARGRLERARTCRVLELVLPMTSTALTAANEESRNHSQPSREADDREQRGRRARARAAGCTRTIAGHVRRRGRRLLPGERAAERVDVAGAEREHEVAVAQPVAQVGLGVAGGRHPGHRRRRRRRRRPRRPAGR